MFLPVLGAVAEHVATAPQPHPPSDCICFYSRVDKVPLNAQSAAHLCHDNKVGESLVFTLLMACMVIWSPHDWIRIIEMRLRNPLTVVFPQGGN